jgi:tRNA nucleotidyltransferase (CCA-adding enzyme)
LRDTLEIKSRLKTLDSRLTNSQIYRLLHGYSQTAISANLLASDSPVAHQHLETFNSKLRYIKPALSGNDLLKMGIPQGPQIKEILARLLEARLDGKVKSKRGEVEMVKGWNRNE